MTALTWLVYAYNVGENFTYGVTFLFGTVIYGSVKPGITPYFLEDYGSPHLCTLNWHLRSQREAR